MKKWMLFLCAAAFAFYSCNKDGVIEKTVPHVPEIELDSETDTYLVKVNKPLTITPTVRYADNAGYTWSIDGKVVGEGKTFTHTWSTPGEVFILLRVETKDGYAEKEMRVDVAELAPPVISFAVPAGGLKVVAHTDYLLSPDIQNGDGDDFSCKWELDGRQVGTEKTYTFNGASTGTYHLKVTAANSDGTTVRELDIEVVDRLPASVFFPQQSYVNTSTARFVFSDRTIYLAPVVENIANPTYVWEVGGVPVSGETGRIYAFRPEAKGTYTVKVTVSEAVAAGDMKALTRNVRQGGVSVGAEVQVTCVEEKEADRMRSAAAGNSASWNKVYEFTPAPGQFVGEVTEGGYTGTESTPQSAVEYAEKRLAAKNFVSLGGFGGYIVVGFDHSIANSGDYDFAVGGNAFEGSNEPGIVYVMQDVNGNGQPDDEWYELKGSETGKSGTKQDYAVTYYRPAGKRMNVRWTASDGKSGSIDYLYEFHKQDFYYPAWVTDDTYTLRGTCLEARNVLDAVTGTWDNAAYDWGYADNSGTDGSAGDAEGTGQENRFKISHAVNRDGTAANLKYIDFVKVQTGVLAKSGWTGELSTEVCSFTDLALRK